MLPPDFRWVPRHQHATDEIALELHGKQVAMLLSGVDGTWSARLECHWPIEAPLVLKPCSSFEKGKEGVETWAERHEARLRREVADPAGLARRFAREAEE